MKQNLDKAAWFALHLRILDYLGELNAMWCLVISNGAAGDLAHEHRAHRFNIKSMAIDYIYIFYNLNASLIFTSCGTISINLHLY